MTLQESKAFSGFAVKDLAAAKEFYGGQLGLRITGDGPLATLHLGGDREVLCYEQPTSTAASYTILNFPVADVDATVRELTDKGLRFERYDGMPQDEYGVMHDNGPTIAWFTDPSGNVLSIISES